MMVLGVGVGAACGCTGTLTFAEELVDPPPEPPPAVIAAAPNTESLWLETIDDRSVSWVVTGAGAPIFFGAGDPSGWSRWEGETTPLSNGAAVELSAALSVAQWDAGNVLVAHGQGLSVLEHERSLPSPVQQHLGDTALSDMVVAHENGTPTVWLGTATGLWRWAGQVLEAVTPKGYPVVAPRLAFGPVLRNGPALWVVSEGRLYGIDSTASGLSAWESGLDCEALDLGADGDGGLWVQCAQSLHYRSVEAVWHLVELPSPLTTLLTHPDAAGAWLQTEDQRFWHAHGNSLWPVELSVAGSAYAADSRGGLLVASDAGLYRASPGRGVTLENMPPDGVLVVDTTLRFSLEEEALVETVRVTLNGEPASLEPGAREFSLSPASLTEGVHTLEIHVAYSDTEQGAVSRVHLKVMHLSWQRDIAPLVAAECSSCHGPEGPVALKLHTYQQWVDDAAEIVAALESGLMPPGVPLDKEKLDTVRYWNAAGRPQ